MIAERARCPTCGNWLRFGTVDGLAVEYCGTCRREELVPRREAPAERLPKIHQKVPRQPPQQRLGDR